MAGGKRGADTVAPIGSARPRSPAPAEPPAAAARQSSRKCTGWASRGGRTGRKRARAPGIAPQVAHPSESEAHPPQRGCAPTGAAARRMRAPRRAPWAPRRPMQLAAGAKKPPPRGGKAAGPSPGPRPMTSRPRRGSGCARPSSTAGGARLAPLPISGSDQTTIVARIRKWVQSAIKYVPVFGSSKVSLRLSPRWSLVRC